ncbi:glycosyl transferase family 90-domain-containing protein [Nemania sp. FL0916]|nr:glycosyl transferase family 90-domain-containing protein [Nemania sp. FL0916]
MHRTQSARVRRLCIILSLLLLIYLIFLKGHQGWTPNPSRERISKPPIIPSNPPSPDVFQALNLNEAECKAVFPDLTNDIDAVVALGPFKLTPPRGNNNNGPLLARIRDGKLTILHASDNLHLSPELIQARSAALHQISRALTTSPPSSIPLPDTIFALNIRDQPSGTAWSYARPAWGAVGIGMPPLRRAFLMPHFAFWNWPPAAVGSVSRAAGAVAEIEQGDEGGEGGEGEEGKALKFRDKDPRVVWRGSTRFSPPQYPTLRRDLLRATAGEENEVWADVQGLDGYEVADGNTTTTEMMMVEDFCQYKYVLYTDGVTYSGRLPFLQLCNSVLLSPPMAWRQFTTHLIKPLFSRDLDLDPSFSPGKPTWTPSSGEQRAWPTHYRPEDANAVFVAPDWSDLRATIAWLEDHADIAEGIARRQRDLFVGRGYLSPAMETCYWRALIRGWSEVVRFDEEEWGGLHGVSWEEFSVVGKVR